MLELLSRIKVEIARQGLSEISEIKLGSIAVHWRGLTEPQEQEIKYKVNTGIVPLLHGSGLVISDFDGGAEIRFPGRNKGYAVDTVLNESGNDAVAAYLGDDLTDEDAFKTIRGRGIGILVREEFRKTEADLWLKPPEDLINFLAEWIKFN